MPRHPRCELEIDVHAVVRQQHDGLGALAARVVDRLLQTLFLDAERPVGNEVARIGDRRIRKCLADDRDRDAVDRLDHVRLEHRIAEVGGSHVLGDEIDATREIAVDDLSDPLRTIGEFPMAGHHVHAEQLGGIDHVLAPGPQRGRRALPAVAAVEQQCAGALAAQALDQRRKMRESAHRAIGTRRALEIEMGESMRGTRSRCDAEVLEQRLADQVRRLAARGADAEVDARLAKPRRVQLCMAVGDVQQADVAERLQRVVQVLAVRAVGGRLASIGNPATAAAASPCRNSRRFTIRSSHDPRRRPRAPRRIGLTG